MQCVAEMIDIFIASENKIPLNEHPHKMPLLDIFLPWLLRPPVLESGARRDFSGVFLVTSTCRFTEA